MSSRRRLAGERWSVRMFLVAFQTELAACLNHMLYYKAYTSIFAEGATPADRFCNGKAGDKICWKEKYQKERKYQ